MPSHPPQLPVRIPLRRPRAAERSRRRGWALGVSLAVHALAVLAVSMAGGGDPEPGVRRPVEQATYVEISWPRVAATFQPPVPNASARPTNGGYGVVIPPPPDAVAAADSAITAHASSPSAATDAAPEQVDGPGAGAAGVADAPGRMRTGAGLGDARLIVTAPRGGAMPADDARYLASFQAALRAFNDSVQGLADRERRVSAWTWTDGRGRVWGVRNGVIFIAGQPVGTAQMTGDRDPELATRRLARHREQIDYHADRVQRERHLQERGRAVRARAAGERAAIQP
jgi:hypothetical protein